jgi:hypothetical protein
MGGSAVKRAALLRNERLCCETSGSAAKRAALLRNARLCCETRRSATKRAALLRNERPVLLLVLVYSSKNTLLLKSLASCDDILHVP